MQAITRDRIKQVFYDSGNKRTRDKSPRPLWEKYFTAKEVVEKAEYPTPTNVYEARLFVGGVRRHIYQVADDEVEINGRLLCTIKLKGSPAVYGFTKKPSNYVLNDARRKRSIDSQAERYKKIHGITIAKIPEKIRKSLEVHVNIK